MQYIEELERLIFLLEGIDNINSKKISKARSLIKKSLNLQKKSFEYLIDAFHSCKSINEENEISHPLLDIILCQLDYLYNFDQLEEECKHKEAIQLEVNKAEWNKVSMLVPSGYTETNIDLHDCAMRIVGKAKALFKTEPLKAKVWSYRWDDSLALSCDLISLTSELSMSTTVAAVGRQMLDYLEEPEVYDMSEALHLVGLITKALDAEVIIGLGFNEVNPAVLAKPLNENHNSGEIRL